MASAWWKRFFDEEYLAFYAGLLPVREATADAEFVDRALALEPRARILDLGCGFGRHAVPLARRGHRVTGVDLSAPMLERAARLAADAGVGVTLLVRAGFEIEQLYGALDDKPFQWNRSVRQVWVARRPA